MQARRIAYLRPGTKMPVNVTFVRVLEEAFPEYEIETLDLWELLKQHRGVQLRNYLHALAEFGPRSLARRDGSHYRHRTRYFFHAVNRLFRERIAAGRFDFSIQAQSLFDGYGGVPHFVYTDHTHISNLEYEAFDRRRLVHAWLPLEREIYHHATKVFAMSSNVLETLVDYYALPADRVACIYTGPNAAGPGGAIDAAKYATKNILFVGVDWERKGGPALARAFERIRNAHPDAHLTIVGCSPDLDLANCTVAGRVPVAEVSAFYARSSIFCMPTTQEPFGIVFVEALAHGLPIVATRVGALPDMVIDDHNGYLVAPGDVDALAEKLGLLLDDADRRKRLGTAGRALADQRYNWTQVGRTMRRHVSAAIAGMSPALPGTAESATRSPRP